MIKNNSAHLKTLSVIVPVYNHATILVQNVQRIVACLDSLPLDEYEIILINDGSLDNSILKMSAIENDHIIKISKKNKGLGSVIRLGSMIAKGNLILIIDLDLSYGILNMTKAFQLIDLCDCVVCSKYLSHNAYSKFKSALSFIAYWSLNRLTNLPIRDIGSGLIMYKSTLIHSHLLMSQGFGIHFELFYTLQKNKAKMIEMPIDYHHEPGSYHPLRHSLSIVKEIGQFLWRQWFQKK